MTSGDLAQGRRLADTRMGDFPIEYEDLQPGDHWLVMNRSATRLLNVRDYPEDRYWGRSARYDGNLTGLVLGLMTPTDPPMYGMLSIHTVRVEDDGTISVRPGDGSSNSILIKSGESGPMYHGYMDHSVWREC